MIGVIIVDYNSKRLLRRCLNSLAALGREDLGIIVVDNGGSIDVERLCADFPGLTLLCPGANLGFAGGCNVGIEHALRNGCSSRRVICSVVNEGSCFFGTCLSQPFLKGSPML